MRNHYGKSLRTHYSPTRKNKQNLNYCKSYRTYLNDEFPDYDEFLNFNTYPYEKIILLNNKPLLKNFLYKSVNNPYLNYHFRKQYINLDTNEKDKLIKSFNKINPYYFQDKVKSLQKEIINEKVKNRINIQRDAIKQLSLNKLINPSEKEKLQKLNESSENPLLPYYSSHPLENIDYYKNEYLRKYNKRKEIKDYYNITQFQEPFNMNIDPIIHTRANFIIPDYEKNKVIKQKKYKDELDEQVLRNNINKMNQYIEDTNNEKLMNKIYNDYETFLKNKENEEKYNKENEMLKDNIILENYKQYKNNYSNNRGKDNIKNIRKKRQKEDSHKKYGKKEKTIENLIIKEKNNEDNTENIIWKNYSEVNIVKCKHGKELYKCLKCGKKYSRDQVHKVIY